jgi:hypothetical protein
VKIRGELVLRNVRELHQPGLAALQREQDMPRGGVRIGPQWGSQGAGSLLFAEVVCGGVRSYVWCATAA